MILFFLFYDSIIDCLTDIYKRIIQLIKSFIKNISTLDIIKIFNLTNMCNYKSLRGILISIFLRGQKNKKRKRKFQVIASIPSLIWISISMIVLHQWHDFEVLTKLWQLFKLSLAMLFFFLVNFFFSLKYDLNIIEPHYCIN